MTQKSQRLQWFHNQNWLRVLPLSLNKTTIIKNEKNLLYHYRTWRIRRYGMGRASIPFILAHTNVLGWWWNLHSYRFAPIVFLWFAFVRLIKRSSFDYHSHYTSSLITIDDFIFNVNIYPAWVIFNNLLLLLVLIAAAICSLIFLYAWVSVSVHGGGEMMPLTCTVWHGRLGTLAIAHHHSSEVRTTLLLIFMFQFQYRLIIDSRRICLKLSFFSIFFGFETCLSSWGGGVRCPRWPGEPTALSGVSPLLPGSYLIGIPIGDPVGSGCFLSLSCYP